MQTIRYIKLSFVMLTMVLAFQNCNRVAPSVAFSEKSGASTDSGIPYEGKIYILSGAVCADGTAIQARLVIKSATSAELNRRDCHDIPPLLLSATDFKIDSTNPDLLVYQDKSFTAWSPNSIGSGYGTLPVLVKPVDPTAYGAKGDGVTDNTTAFISALAAGDILIPAGTYIIQGTIKVPAGRNIQCASSSTVHIINPVHSTTSNHMFQFWSTGGSISNCHLSGSSDFNVNGSAAYDETMAFNFLVTIVDYWATVSQVKVVNNIFDNCHGNTCIAVYGASASGGLAIGNSIIYNTFRTCGMSGVLIDAGTDNLVAYNSATDCALIVANDTANSVNSNNILEYNSLHVNFGTGYAFNVGYFVDTLGISGGQTGSANYSSNIVRNNTLVGNGILNSVSLGVQTTYPAQYYNNSCTNGCTVR